jgi:transposase InsO family protein
MSAMASRTLRWPFGVIADSVCLGAHKVYPYLLGGIAIERVNQVWCADVTYIPMAWGFLYLVVIMDCLQFALRVASDDPL